MIGKETRAKQLSSTSPVRRSISCHFAQDEFDAKQKEIEGVVNPIMLETQKLLLQTAHRGQVDRTESRVCGGSAKLPKELLQKVKRMGDCDSEATPTSPRKCEHLRMKVYQAWR